MEQVKEHLLYVDDDSIVYVHHHSRPDPSTVDFFGDLANELKPG